jgi:trehalose-phosphatase
MKIVLFMDFDGTLVNIAKFPYYAKVKKEVSQTLENLSKKNWIKLAIVTGRTIESVKKRLKIKNIAIMGNHGLDIYLPSGKTIYKAPGAKKETAALAAKLKKSLKHIKGVLIESKGSTLSAHYRMVSPRDLKKFYTVYNEVTHGTKLKAVHGKKVIELKPDIKWDKGYAANWYLNYLGGTRKYLPVYIGDDANDEPAFKTLKKGITIFVGSQSKNTNAKYFVKNTDEVLNFIKSLEAIWK